MECNLAGCGEIKNLKELIEQLEIETLIPNICPCCGYTNVSTRAVCNAEIPKGLRKEIIKRDERITKLESEIVKLKTQMLPNEYEQLSIEAINKGHPERR